jgi:organic hydroperoxide reductase OsmC/OhrA
LFVASLNSCYILTLLAIASCFKIQRVSVASSAKGKLEKIFGSYPVTEVVEKPRIDLASANNLARMPWKIEKAKENCFVPNAIKSALTSGV